MLRSSRRRWKLETNLKVTGMPGCVYSRPWKDDLIQMNLGVHRQALPVERTVPILVRSWSAAWTRQRPTINGCRHPVM